MLRKQNHSKQRYVDLGSDTWAKLTRWCQKMVGEEKIKYGKLEPFLDDDFLVGVGVIM